MHRHPHLSRPRKRIGLLPVACGMVALAFAGCTPQPIQRPRSPETQSDLLRARYRDLASGRFAVLADFEEPSHAELFHLSGPATTDADLALSLTGGIAATGAGCLAVRFESTDMRLAANNVSAQSWLLKRDWRAYNLLLVNVHSPIDDLAMDIAIAGGDDEFLQEANSRVRLHRGWNLLRLDLDEVGDYLALDDVREVRWSLPALAAPVELRFDDLVLTDSRTALMGAADGAAGTLYVEQAGRRLLVGAVGRFELAFANGQIVRWFALPTDPARLDDLVGPGNTLGPTPVIVPARDDWVSDQALRWPGGMNPRHNTLVTRQRLIEANAVRVVVEADWALADATDGGDSGATLAQWRYVVYPSGQIYTSVMIADADLGEPAGRLGLLVSGKPRPKMIVEVHEPGGLGDRPGLAHLSYASLATADDTGLLFVAHDGEQMRHLRVVRAPDRPRISVVACGDDPWLAGAWRSALLSLLPARGTAGPDVEALALSYGRPATPEFLVGGLAPGAVGDTDEDGFDEQTGAYLVKPDANRVQLKLDGRRGAIVSPAFCVVESAGREAWVYVDYVVQTAVARDAEGRLVFQVPGRIDGERLVEVYLRNPAVGAGSARP